ncbi:MAG TPA: hypothetical protein EYG11_12445 [Candidatus Latescibacteria bacterium]|nr:hypothetical protein [Candidatus Latescibacterota bacterium]
MIGQFYFALVSRRGPSALLIAIAVLGTYANSLDNGFQYDDRHSIVENHHLRSLDNVAHYFTHPEYFSRDADKAMYRPLLLVTFALNYAWGQYEVGSYHLVNIALHLGCALLVWGLLRRLQQPPCMSLFGALFFAVHPIASEPVNYISSRSELLAAFGVLAGLVLYLRAEERASSVYYAVSVLCFAVGLLSKSIALVLPVWIVLWQWQRGQIAASWTRLWPYVLIAAGYVLIIRSFLVKAVLADPVRSWPEQIGTQVKALVYYSMLFFAPFRLNVDHGFTVSALDDVVVYLGGLAIGSLFLLLGGLSRMGLLWILAALLPTLVVPLNVLVNEHRLYLPLVGLVIALLGMRSLQKMHGLRWGGPVVLLLLALLTIERNQIWHDEISLWGDAADKNTSSVRPQIYLGNAARHLGQSRRAEYHYRRALQLEAEHPVVHANLGNVYQDLQQYDLAIETFSGLLADHPEMTDVHYSLGRAYQFAGQSEQAQAQYHVLPDSSPHRRLADNNLGTIHEGAGRIDSALYYYGRAGEFAQAQNNRRRLLGGQTHKLRQMLDAGQLRPAEELARLLVAASGDQRDPRFMLAVALFLQRRYAESIVENQRLLTDYPNFDEGLLQLALVQETSGQLSQALATYQILSKRAQSLPMQQTAKERMRVLKERMP